MIVLRKDDGMTEVRFESSKERLSSIKERKVVIPSHGFWLTWDEMPVMVWDSHPTDPNLQGPLVMIQLPTTIAVYHGLVP